MRLPSSLATMIVSKLGSARDWNRLWSSGNQTAFLSRVVFHATQRDRPDITHAEHGNTLCSGLLPWTSAGKLSISPGRQVNTRSMRSDGSKFGPAMTPASPNNLTFVAGARSPIKQPLISSRASVFCTRSGFVRSRLLSIKSGRSTRTAASYPINCIEPVWRRPIARLGKGDAVQSQQAAIVW